MSTDIKESKFSADELNVLKQIFNNFDKEKKGHLSLANLPALLDSFGQDKDNTKSIITEAKKHANNNTIDFDHLVHILQYTSSYSHHDQEPSGDNNNDNNNDSIIPYDLHNDNNQLTTTATSSQEEEDEDQKVLEFLKILEEYRIKCEEEGNYLEAGRAYKQLSMLRKQEEKRQQNAIKMKQMIERQEIQNEQNKQYEEFNLAWDKYMEEYDTMAQQYIIQMTERHAMILLELQNKLRQEVVTKPPRFSKELIEQRRKQITSARNRQYKEAQQLKKICDLLEEKEMNEMEQTHAVNFARREAKFRVQQQAELQALLKRIEGRRKEHIKQRNLDSKRLLQRNRNIQTTLESQHVLDAQKLFEQVKKTLNHVNPSCSDNINSSLRNSLSPDREVALMMEKKRNNSVSMANNSAKTSSSGFLPAGVTAKQKAQHAAGSNGLNKHSNNSNNNSHNNSSNSLPRGQNGLGNNTTTTNNNLSYSNNISPNTTVSPDSTLASTQSHSPHSFSQPPKPKMNEFLYATSPDEENNNYDNNDDDTTNNNVHVNNNNDEYESSSSSSSSSHQPQFLNSQGPTLGNNGSLAKSSCSRRG